MQDSAPVNEPGWYYAQGDPPGTQRFWDGVRWVGVPVVAPPNPASVGPYQTDPAHGGRHNEYGARSASARTGLYSKRIGGFLVDGLAFGVVLVLGFPLLGIIRWLSDSLASAGIFWFLLPPFAITGFAFNFWNHVVLVGGSGSSIGKRSVNTAIVDHDSGELPSAAALSTRFLLINALWWLPWWLGALIPWLGVMAAPIWLLAVVDAIWPWWDDDGQRLVDKVANTVVVSRRTLESSPDSVTRPTPPPSL